MLHKFFTLIFILISLDSYCSKRDTSSFKSTFGVNIEALVFRDIKLTFTKQIKKRKYLETMVSFSIPYGENSNVSDNYTWGLKDPFFYYGRVQLRMGIRKYSMKQSQIRRFYMAPMLSLSYGAFKEGDAWYTNGGFHEIVTRHKIDIEPLYKIGWTFHRRHFLQDFYLGAGLRFKCLFDIVYQDEYQDTQSYRPHPAYPYHSNHFYVVPTFHLGYQFGECD